VFKSAFSTHQGTLNRWMGAMVANDNDAVDFNFREGTVVVVRVHVRKGMAYRGRGEVRPGADLVPKPCLQFVLNGVSARSVSSWTYQRSDDPMLARWMGVKVGGQMNVEHVVPILSPRFVQQQPGLFERRAIRFKHQNNRSPLGDDVIDACRWEEVRCEVLRNGENHTVKCVVNPANRHALCTNLGDGGIEVNVG